MPPTWRTLSYLETVIAPNGIDSITGQNVQDFLLSVYPPTVICAAPTGVAATDTAAINAAIGELSAAGGTVLLWPGVYAVNATITIGVDNVTIVGQGRGGNGNATGPKTGATRIDFSLTNADLFAVTHDNFHIYDLDLNCTGVATAGYAINESGGANARFGLFVNNVQITHFYRGIFMGGNFQDKVSFCEIVDCVNRGIVVQTWSGGNDYGAQQICNCDIYSTTAKQPLTAIEVVGVRDLRISDCNCYWFTGDGLLIDPTGLSQQGPSNVAANIQVVNSILWGDDCGIKIVGGSADPILDIMVTNCRMISSNVGVYISNPAASSDRILLNNCIIRSNVFTGVDVATFNGAVTITGCHVSDCTDAAANGILIEAGAKTFTLAGNTCINNPVYGIKINAATFTSGLVDANNLHGNGTGGLDNLSTGGVTVGTNAP